MTISDGEAKAFDLARLERAVAALILQHRDVVHRQARLRRAVEERDRRIQNLESDLLESNQRRQDAVKRIDDLIAQLDQLEGRLGPGRA